MRYLLPVGIAFSDPSFSPMMRAFAASFIAHGRPSVSKWTSIRLRLKPIRTCLTQENCEEWFSSVVRRLVDKLPRTDIIALENGAFYLSQDDSYLNVLVIVNSQSQLVRTSPLKNVRYPFPDEDVIIELTSNRDRMFSNCEFSAHSRFFLAQTFDKQKYLNPTTSKEVVEFLTDNVDSFAHYEIFDSVLDMYEFLNQPRVSSYGVRYAYVDGEHHVLLSCYQTNLGYKQLLNTLMDYGVVIDAHSPLLDFLDRSRKLKQCLEFPNKMSVYLRNDSCSGMIRDILTCFLSHPIEQSNDFLDCQLYYMLDKEGVCAS